MATTTSVWPVDRTVNGTPAAGTDAVHTLTIGGTPSEAEGSGFYLSCEGFISSLILWSATNTTLVTRVDAALEALTSIGTGGVTTAVGVMTAGVGTLTLTMAGANAKKAKGRILAHKSVMAGTTPTLAVVETTPGVDAFGRGLATGVQIINGVTGAIFYNSGTAVSPAWTAV